MFEIVEVINGRFELNDNQRVYVFYYTITSFTYTVHIYLQVNFKNNQFIFVS